MGAASAGLEEEPGGMEDELPSGVDEGEEESEGAEGTGTTGGETDGLGTAVVTVFDCVKRALNFCISLQHKRLSAENSKQRNR